MLSKEISSTIFKLFGMTWPWIELRSPGSLANTLPTRPMSRLNLVIVHRKIKRNRKDKYLGFAWELKKSMEHEGDDDNNRNLCTWNNLERIGKGTGRLRNQRTSKDHPDYNIKNNKNTEKSPWDLRGLAVTQTPFRKRQLTLISKTLSIK